MNQHSTRADRLRAAGYKRTNARLTVLQVLEDGGGHMTSAEIVIAVAAIDATIGRASVFRTLDLLTRLAIVRPTYIEAGSGPVYVLMPQGHHHHIICTICHQVIEFDDCGLGALAQRLETEYGVTLTGHLLEFYGECGVCSAENAATESTKTDN